MYTSQGGEERARSLLLEHLTPTQRRTLNTSGYFEFRGKRGSVFRLYTQQGLARRGYVGSNDAYRLVEIKPALGSDGAKVATNLTGRNIYAIGSRDKNPGWRPGAASIAVILPESDTLLAVKLALEVDEEWRNAGCTAVLNRDKLGIKPTRRRIRVN